MKAHELPTWNEIVGNTRESLNNTRNAASEARDWIMSDWRPVDTSLTDEAAEARTTVLKLVGQIKGLVDQAKDALARAEDGTGRPRRA